MKKFLCFIGVLGMVLAGLVQSAGAQTTITTTTISTDTTWTAAGSPYIVTGAVYVKGSPTVTLTIEPGVEVRFAFQNGLYIGSHQGDPSHRGKLIADGTNGTITFTSDQATHTAGYWDNIRFNYYCHGSLLKNVVVEYGGRYERGNIYCESASPDIQNSIIRNSSKYGIYIANQSLPRIDNNTIADNYNDGIYITGGATPDSGTPSISGNTFEANFGYPITSAPGFVGYMTNNTYFANLYNFINVLGGWVNTDATWANQGIPYVITGGYPDGVYVGGAATPTLTIAPGVEIRFGYDTFLNIGESVNYGKLIADGTLGTITFTSHQATHTAGYWSGILFNNSNMGSFLKNVVVEYGGGIYGCGNIYCNYGNLVTIQNSVIRNSSGYGIYSNGTPLNILNNIIRDNNKEGIYGNTTASQTIGTNTFINNGSYPIRVRANSVRNVTGNTFTNNNPDAIYVFGDTVNTTCTWLNPGVPYVIGGDVSVGGAATPTLTIAPAVELRFATSTSLIIDGYNKGKLIADGTNGTITFTSDQATHTAGYWGCIWFRNYNAESLLKNVIVEYGGYYYGLNIYCYLGASPTIRDSIIRYGSGHGIYCSGSSPIIGTNTISNNANAGIYAVYDAYAYSNPTIAWNTITANKYGIYSDDRSSPIITPNNIYGNTDYGIWNYPYKTLSAINNWWGASDGPSGTGTGSGDKVNKGVNYIPWLYSPIAYGSIIGTITYTGTQTGTLYAQGYTNPLFTGTPTAQATATSPYHLTYLSPANYYVRAFLDTNSNQGFDDGEPQNCYGTPTAISVESATNTTNINITIKGAEIPGSLSVTSIPPGARIYLDGNDTGQFTNHTFTGKQPGTYAVKLTQYGYFDWYGTATVESDKTAYISATLTYIACRLYGTVTDKDSLLPVAGARISVIREGTTTITATATTSSAGTYTISNLLCGTYTVYATATGYLVSSQTTYLTPGQVKQLNFAIERQKIDVHLAKSAPAESFAGERIAYGLTYGNSGNTEAKGVVIKDTLPAEVTYSVSTLAPANVTPGTPTTITWNIGTLQPYSTYTITLYGTISTGVIGSTTLTNYATITTTSTETTLVNNYASTTTHIATPGVDLVIRKYAHSSVRQGNELIYQILYDNYGQVDAGDVVITEHLPAGVTYATDTLGNANVTPGTITWQIGTLTPYSFGYFELTVKVDGTGTLINQIEISSPALEATLNNNLATCTTQVEERVIDLVVNKSAVPQIPEGGQLTYRIYYTNYGNKDVGNVVLVDTLPAGVTYATDTLGGKPIGNTVTWNIGTLTAGTSSLIELTVDVTAGSGTILTNQITISPTDSQPENNIASATTRVTEFFSDVWVSKSAPDTAAAGYEMVYRFGYGNSGNRPATNTVLTDKLPGSVTYISDTSGLPVSGTSTGNLIWQIGTLSAKVSRPFDLKVKVGDGIAGSTTITNYATITTTNDKNATNNSATATTVILAPLPNVYIYKSSDKDEVIPGDILEYTIRYYNSGNGRAENVQIIDKLPADCDYKSDTLGNATFDNGTITWGLGTLEPGTFSSFKLTVKVKDTATGTLINVVQINTTTPNDPMNNNQSTYTVKVVEPKIDLAISKAGPKEVIAGTEITYTIRYENRGNAGVGSVTITDILPPHTSYVSDTINNGSTTWHLGTLSAFAKGEFNLVVYVAENTPGSSNLTNTVKITGIGTDTDTANNYATVSTHIVARAVDLVVSKSGPTEVMPLSQITYTIFYSNQGNVPANNVTIRDTIPTGTTYLSDTSGLPVSGTATQVIIWQAGTLTPSGTRTFTLIVFVGNLQGSTTLGNLVEIAFPGTDNNPANNQATWTTHITTSPPPPPSTYDLEVEKDGPAEIVIDPYDFGTEVKYTIWYANNGPNEARGVVITDTLPVGLLYWDATGHFKSVKVDHTERYIVFDIGNLDAGDWGKITLTALVDIGELEKSNIFSFTNSVEIFPQWNDSNPSNNKTSCKTEWAKPHLWMKLHIPKEVMINPFSDQTVVKYVIEVGNDGKGWLTDVEICEMHSFEEDRIIKINYLKPGETKRFERQRILDNESIYGSQTLTTDVITTGYDYPKNPQNIWITSSQIMGIPHLKDPEIDLWVTKKGPEEVAAGEIITYTISYGNDSDIDLHDIIISDTLPWEVTYISDTSDILVQEGGFSKFWELSCLPANTSGSFELKGRVFPNVPGSTTLVNRIEVEIDSMMVVDEIPNNIASWTTHVKEKPVPDVFVKIKPSKAGLRGGESKQVTVFYGNRGTGNADDVELTWWSSTGVFENRYLGSLKPGETGQVEFGVTAPDYDTTIYEEATIITQSDDTIYSNNTDICYERVVRGHDPNDKFPSPQDFIVPGEEITYRVRFENVATATCPVQYITIEDSLPPQLNWNTFLPGEVNIGTVTYASVEAFNNSGRGSLTLGYNPSTGKIRYKFDLGDDYGTTGLKPNVNPPEGEGWVEFSVDTLATLTTGTKIINTANIQFDWNEWMETPAAVNIVDLTAPTSTVKPLPAISTATTFPIEWAGTDTAGAETGRAREYTVYVSDNGGTPTAWHNENVWANFSPQFTGSKQFTGEYGHTYGFYCQAMDAMGNLQPAPPAPQATIKLIAEDIRIRASGAVAMEVGGSVTLFCLAKGTDSAVPATWTLSGDIGSLSSAFGTQTTFEAKKIGKGVLTASDGTSTTQIPLVVGECVDMLNDWQGTLTANWGTATVRFGTTTDEMYLLPLGTVTQAILASLAGNIGAGLKINAYGTSATEISGTLTTPVQVRFNYNEAVLGNIDENTLVLYLSSNGTIWQVVVDSNRDPATNIVYGTITHLSYVAPAGKSKITAASDLTAVFVYPNPCYATRGHQLHFKRLTAQCTIKIFNIVGELVKEIDHTNGTDEEVWTNPNEVASGIYIYLITNNQGQKAIGKLGIIK